MSLRSLLFVFLLGQVAYGQLVPFSFVKKNTTFCSLPWGGNINHGQSVTAYSSPTPAGLCSNFDEVRSCTSGSLSGSFNNENCDDGCLSTPWGNVIHGYSNTAYSTSTPTAACSTVDETRTCTSGTLSGSFTQTSCNDGCTGTPWGSVAHGYSNTAYSTSAPVGAACSTVDQTRSCSNGTLSGSFTSTSCNNGCAATSISNCTIGARAHGGSSGTCASGYSGSCSYSCSNGSNNTVSNSCSPSCTSSNNSHNMCAGYTLTAGAAQGCGPCIGYVTSVMGTFCASGSGTVTNCDHGISCTLTCN